MNLWNHRYQWISNIQKKEWIRIDIVEDQLTSKQYIAKSIRKDAGDVLIHQFHMEVNVLSMIHHTHMPEIIDVFEQEKTYVLIETKIPGLSLEEWFKEHRIQKRLLKSYIFIQCMKRIEYLHTHEVLYIDIKLDNFMIYHSTIYLIDFNSCIYENARNAYMASKINCSPELFTIESKKKSSDVYALGTMMNPFYTVGFVHQLIKKSIHSNPNKRFQSISSFKKTFISYLAVRGILIFIFLSVCVVNIFQGKEGKPMSRYLKDTKNEMLFRDAYFNTLSKQEGSYIEKVQMNLYEWIENDYIQNSIENPDISKFLIEQAILTQNPVYCQYFLEHVKIQEPYLEEMLHILSDDHYPITDDFLHMYLSQIVDSNNLNTLSSFMTILISNQKILSDSDLDLLIQLHEEVNENTYDYTNMAILYLQYCLFLSGQNRDLPPIPSFYLELVQKDEQVQTLIQYIRRVQ